MYVMTDIDVQVTKQAPMYQLLYQLLVITIIISGIFQCMKTCVIKKFTAGIFQLPPSLRN